MSSRGPAVTAIIATYNKCETLRYAIDSVLWQTFDDFELWVIGDACTDGTEELVATYSDPRLHWYNLSENSGYQSGPNNEGLRRARGQYIAYLNHDDIWLPNHLQVLVDCIRASEADFVFSILEMIKPGGRISLEAPQYPNAHLPPHATATLHRKEVITDLGYWKSPDEIHGYPRVEYFRRAQFLGKKFALAPDLTALMFWTKSGDRYDQAGPQAEFMAQIRNDPEFARHQLALLLVQIHQELETLATPQRFRTQIIRTIQRAFVRHGIHPESAQFWKQPGQRIKNWRRNHGLPTD
jgi:glycosyltransferase involved in cell wall biosynthesis